MRLILLSAFISFTFSSVFADGDNAYEIKFKIKGLENEQLILANYYGDKQYVKDTIVLNAKGIGYATGKEPLEQGIYLAYFPGVKAGSKYFEFIVNEQKFSLETAKGDFIRNMKVTDSKENSLFYSDMLFIRKKRAESQKLKTKRDVLKKDPEKKDSIKIINDLLKKIDEEVMEYRNKLINDNRETFYSNMLRMMRDPEIPESVDSTKKYEYYITHFWDDIDFSMRGLIRTPVYHDKIKTYHTKLLPQIPDTLKKYIDMLLEKTKADSFIFQYTLVHHLNHYARSKLMCFDGVYTHLVLKYYTDKSVVWWPDGTQRYKMTSEAEAIDGLLCGKVAPNVVLADTTLRNYINLHKLPNKYKLVYIWDPECGHCKKETPKLQKLYKTLNEEGIDFEVYSISTVSYEEIDKWKKFIMDNKLTFINVADPYFQSKPNFRELYDVNSTPTIYLLNENNEIIAKKLGVQQIGDFLRRKEGLIKDNGGPIQMTPSEGDDGPGGDKSIGGNPNKKGGKKAN